MMAIIIFNAAIGGWCLRSGLHAVIDGRPGPAFVLTLLGAINLALAVINAGGRA
jgi:heme A synthase